MAIRHSAEKVGCAFISQYYQVLDLRPEDTHKFYKDSSVAGWEGNDGVVHSVTTMKGINDMIMSSDYKDSEVQVKSIHAQDSLQGSILLVVTGNLIGKDEEVTRNFSHTFLLASQERGFFVLNDILRFVDTHPPSTPQESATISIHKPPDSPPSDSVISELDEVLENVCSSKGSALNPSYAEITAETISKPSPDLIHPKQPAAVVHKTTYLETLSKERSCPPALAVQIVRVSAIDGSLVAPKPQLDGINSVGKIATPAGDETAMLFPGSKGIYVGGLPPNTTKHELAEAVKIFGRVKKNDGVQVIQDYKNEDGFTYGFVHFESEESARKAVEAHNFIVRGKEAYITYKKSSTSGGNGGRGRSPPARGGFRQGSPPGKGGSYNNGYHIRRENGGGDYNYYRYEYRNRSSEGQDRDDYQWNNGGWRGRRGWGNSHGGK
ncbi:PREDICTED: ras GTPase-activating protein-binding protein 1-like [Ipomoea nil]|uniref:ras GTPase-activating protein-binding protein 1-like n=1 Tax=Ipomoea nil TaxID=35883 RepID=UPI0009014606|nr:PREDICTED: ras GTPase-activating protein-binding protein 1-like [Ipomoea nil]